MIDYDKMTVAEHEQYREMERKAKAFDEILKAEEYNYKIPLDENEGHVIEWGLDEEEFKDDVLVVIDDYKGVIG